MRKRSSDFKDSVSAIVISLILVMSGALIFHMDGDQIDLSFVSAARTREVHGIISIDGDVNFTSTASSEGWAGSGIAGDPYIIEDYEISGVDSRWCIKIINTTVHFEIRNCILHNTTGGVGDEKLWTGLSLINVTNGLVDGIVCKDMGDGQTEPIYIRSSRHLTLRNILVQDCNRSSLDGSGLVMMESHNNTLDNITLINNGGASYSYGLYLWRSNDNSISNLISEDHWGGVEAFGAYLIDSHRNKFDNVNCSRNIGLKCMTIRIHRAVVLSFCIVQISMSSRIWSYPTALTVCPSIFPTTTYWLPISSRIVTGDSTFMKRTTT